MFRRPFHLARKSPSAYLNYPLIARLMQLRQDIDEGRLTTLARYKVDRAIRLLIRH